MDMMKASMLKNKAVLDKIVKDLTLQPCVECPKCHVVWNKLTPSKICIECEDASNVR